jgi:hypothetical protein
MIIRLTMSSALPPAPDMQSDRRYFVCQAIARSGSRSGTKRKHAAIRHCVGCGCTDDLACPGGCCWVSLDPPLCSAYVAR